MFAAPIKIHGSVYTIPRFRPRGGHATAGVHHACWWCGCVAGSSSRAAVRRLGVLSLGVPTLDFFKDNAATFVRSLSALGWKEGENLAIDWRWYGTDAELAERQAAELIALKPDVIFAPGNPSVEKLQAQTKSVPVVFTLVSDPVGMGYVNSLAHPGGNVTGFMTYDPPIYTKQLQMLTQITPPARTVAVLYNPKTAPYASRLLAAMEPAAQSMGVTLRDSPCHDEAGIEALMVSLAQAGGAGLLTIAEVFNQTHGLAIVGLALKYKIPTNVFAPQMIQGGGLISYAVDFPDLFVRSATYVGRILKGEKPADLPVQAPTKFKLTINLKTAKALNVTIAPALLDTADEVIE
jgi:putative ABC transport system substrate-binding protein